MEPWFKLVTPRKEVRRCAGLVRAQARTKWLESMMGLVVCSAKSGN